MLRIRNRNKHIWAHLQSWHQHSEPIKRPYKLMSSVASKYISTVMTMSASVPFILQSGRMIVAISKRRVCPASSRQLVVTGCSVEAWGWVSLSARRWNLQANNYKKLSDQIKSHNIKKTSKLTSSQDMLYSAKTVRQRAAILKAQTSKSSTCQTEENVNKDESVVKVEFLHAPHFPVNGWD